MLVGEVVVSVDRGGLRSLVRRDAGGVELVGVRVRVDRCGSFATKVKSWRRP